MTREEILNMEPGREMDALVAEKVMGWASLWTDGTHYMMYSPAEQSLGVGYDEREPVPNYSADIAAALEVAEKTRSKKVYLRLADQSEAIGYKARFYNYNNGSGTEWVTASTAPEAIVKAALISLLEIEE